MNQSTTVAEIQNLPIAEMAEMLGALTHAELIELRELEEGSDSPRKGALEVIDDALAAAEPPKVDPPEIVASGAVPAAKPEAPAWQAPEYTGPLDIEQAAWRRRNIKPVRELTTK